MARETDPLAAVDAAQNFRVALHQAINNERRETMKARREAMMQQMGIPVVAAESVVAPVVEDSQRGSV